GRPLHSAGGEGVAGGGGLDRQSSTVAAVFREPVHLRVDIVEAEGQREHRGGAHREPRPAMQAKSVHLHIGAAFRVSGEGRPRREARGGDVTLRVAVEAGVGADTLYEERARIVDTVEACRPTLAP